jgi:hypothetical protein
MSASRHYSFPLVTTDDFENPDSSPVPHYERDWRHPAEFADAERSRHLGSAPPLGRRLTALTVIASVLTSVAVLTVAIPKGIEEYTQFEAETSATTTTIVRVKGSLASSIAVLRGPHGTTSALSLGNRQWLVSSESVAVKKSSALTNQTYTVIRTNEAIGLTVIAVKNGIEVPAVDFFRVESSLTSRELSKYQIMDAFQSHEVALEPSISLHQTTDAHPVNMASPIKGVAVVMNRQGHLVGVLVRRGHAEWALTRQAFLSIATP